MKIPGGGALERKLMRQVEKVQQGLKAAQEELAELRVEGTAGGGAVTAVANGSGELLEVRISPGAVDPSDVEMLQDLVLAAVRDALAKSQQAAAEKMGALTGGLKIPGLM